MIISRINGFTYVQDRVRLPTPASVNVVEREPLIPTVRARDVKCYGADDVPRGRGHHASSRASDVSITGNSTNPTRFQHPVAGTYKKWCVENGKKYFSVASGGGTGRTLHPGQHGGRPLQLRHDRHHGPYAFRRSVRRFFLRPGARRDDGSYRHGQQPDGRRDRRLRCCSRRGYEIIGQPIKYKKGDIRKSVSFFIARIFIRRRILFACEIYTILARILQSIS